MVLFLDIQCCFQYKIRFTGNRVHYENGECWFFFTFSDWSVESIFLDSVLVGISVFHMHYIIYDHKILYKYVFIFMASLVAQW